MTRRTAPLSGLLGGLAFLVLVQGWELASGVRIGWAEKIGVALVVVAAGALLSPALYRAVRRRNGQL
ncbi:MAG: hypothetical protein R3324_05840 [Halobacteriales archaeon]|nr:hypothetical protein [Halobacteriales archaeon]